MPARRTLELRKETLAELTVDDLQAVVGGDWTNECTGKCSFGTFCQAVSRVAPILAASAMVCGQITGAADDA